MDNDGRPLVFTMLKEAAAPNAPPGRLLSVDLFRGIIMFLLIGEATGLYELLLSLLLNGTVLQSIGIQFQHHPWHGLRAWDLGQPFFMFISGVAMVFSYERRWERGISWRATLGHAARRAFVLFVLGWALSHISPSENWGKGEFFLDILPQLALAGLLGFLLLKRSAWFQAGSALGLLLLTEFLYRLWTAPGFDQPFVPGHNFGSYVDLAIFGHLFDGNWVTFNIVPSATFVIIGILAGRLLKHGRSPARILKCFVLSGVSGVAVGLALDPITPIIKRICTSSFVIVSVGLSLLALALAYWLIDVARARVGAVFFICVGMNPLFIYLFALSGGSDWFRSIAQPFTMGFAGWIGEVSAQAVTGFAVWGLLWTLCYWLYRREIFIKI